MDSFYVDPLPDHPLDEEVNKQAIINKYLKIQPLWQFSLLYILSLGLYKIYWYYQQWRFIKEYNQETEIMPFWRAIFWPFFGMDLFNHIRTSAQEKGYTKSYNYGWLLFALIAFNLLGHLPEPYLLLTVFGFIPLLPVVKAQNYFLAQQPGANRARLSLDGIEIFVLFTGTFLVILQILLLLIKNGLISDR